MDPQGGQCKKKMENSIRGVTINLTGNPGGFINFKKSRFLQHGGVGVQFFSGKAHFEILIQENLI